MDFIAAKPLITDLHPRAERSQGGNVLDCKLRYFMYTARSRLVSEAVRILDGLADLEPMIAQMALRVASISNAGLYHEIQACVGMSNQCS
jgi:hypothetical protein